MKKKTPRRKAPRKDAPLYQLKVLLKRSKPPIWRRLVVRADTRLDRLHGVIQVAMGWMNSHLHQFSAGSGAERTYYGNTDPEFGGMDEMEDESKHTVGEIAPVETSGFLYEYDFGDSWVHEVTVEKILPPDPSFKHPVCLAGANAAPPEDCGGIPGYYGMLEILADPKHPEHEEMKEWVGEGWDAERFDLEDVNAELNSIRA